jgi:hypothetical protein
MMGLTETPELIGLYLGAWAIGFCAGYVVRLFRRLAEQAV